MAYTAKQSAKTRGMGGKRVARFPVSTTTEYDNKLKRLSIATGGMDKSRIADMILRIGLDSPHVIEWIQQEYGAQYEEFHFKALDVTNNGIRETIYTSK